MNVVVALIPLLLTAATFGAWVVWPRWADDAPNASGVLVFFSALSIFVWCVEGDLRRAFAGSIHLHPGLSILYVAAAFLLGIGISRWLKRRSTCWPGPPNQNGIGVAAPKLYDSRSLSLMLEEMQEQLKRISGISQKPLTDAIGSSQGQRTETQDFSAEASLIRASGNPAAAAPAKTDSGDKGKDGTAKEKAAAKESGKGADKSSPSTGNASIPAGLAERSADLFSDQVNLTYEVFNLRLLLDRALSDRLYDADQARLQAIIGFPVSVNTPEYASGCAAFIEVTVEAPGTEEPPSVVALLPQERTFNVSSAQRTGGAIGFSAPLKLANLGLKGRVLADQAFLQREADTIAFLGEVSRGEAGQRRPIATFGWQLRPVGGQRSVTAGLRQLFAVLALPRADEALGDSIELRVTSRTYWRRFNARTATTSDRLNVKAWFSNRPVEIRQEWPPVRALSTVAIDNSLAPKIDEIRWYPVGPTRAVAVVRGKNFFPGTFVSMGDQTLRTPDDGLILKSEKNLQLTTALSALMDDAVLSARYGPAVPLSAKPELPTMTLTSAVLSPRQSSDAQQLTLKFSVAEDLSDETWSKFGKLPDPLLQVNGRFINTPLYFYRPAAREIRCLALIPPDVVVAKSYAAVLKFPFFGPAWTFKQVIYTPDPRELSILRAQKNTDVALMISGAVFTDKWKIQLDKEYAVGDEKLRMLDHNVLELTVAPATLEKFDVLIVLPPGEPVVVLPVPGTNTRTLMIDSGSTPQVVETAESGAWLKLAGSNLDLVQKARCNGTDLKCTAQMAGQSVQIELPKEISSVPGLYELVITDTTGRSIPIKFLVSSVTQ